MANVKEAQMAKEELMDNIQKFVLCGRAMLDAMEQIAELFAQSEKCRVENANEAIDDVAAEPETKTKPAEVEADMPTTATLEEVRGLLAEKSRKGFRAEVKALLTTHGVEKLSEISDPLELGRLLGEAKQIGAANG